MSRWSVVCVLLLAWGAAAAEPVSVVSDHGVELRLPAEESRPPLSSAAPAQFEAFQSLFSDERIRLLEVFVTREDIARLEAGEDPRGLEYRIMRHPLSGPVAVGRETWETLRPKYRKTIETTLVSENRALFQENVDTLYNDKLDADEKIRVGGFHQQRTYREDATSVRFFTVASTETGTGDAQRPMFIRAFSATVFIRNRLFLVQATRRLGTVLRTDGAEEDQIEFDLFVDTLIALNQDNTKAR